MRNIHDILDLARKIKGEPNVVSVAIAIFRRRTFRQLADLRWLDGDDEDLSRILEKSAERVAGIFAVEKDGVSFETVGNTTRGARTRHHRRLHDAPRLAGDPKGGGGLMAHNRPSRNLRSMINNRMTQTVRLRPRQEGSRPPTTGEMLATKVIVEHATGEAHFGNQAQSCELCRGAEPWKQFPMSRRLCESTTRRSTCTATSESERGSCAVNSGRLGRVQPAKKSKRGPKKHHGDADGAKRQGVEIRKPILSSCDIRHHDVKKALLHPEAAPSWA